MKISKTIFLFDRKERQIGYSSELPSKTRLLAHQNSQSYSGYMVHRALENQSLPHVYYIKVQFEQQTSLAYFFCVSEGHATSEPCAIFMSWIAQLVQQSVEAIDIACRVFGPDEQRAISWVGKWKCFRALCRELPSCTFVIDGFDECKSINKTSKYYTDDGRSKFLRNCSKKRPKQNFGFCLLVEIAPT